MSQGLRDSFVKSLRRYLDGMRDADAVFNSDTAAREGHETNFSYSSLFALQK